MVEQRVVIVESPKNVGVAMMLAIVFGPLGLLYASVWGGFFMFVVSIYVGIMTAGVGLIVTWLVCIVWAYRAANDFNAKNAGTRW